MTFHLPLVDKIFDLSRKQQPNRLLASLDILRWRYNVMKNHLLSSHKGCTTNDVNTVGKKFVYHIIKSTTSPSINDGGHGDIFIKSPYFISGLILYDTSIIRHYNIDNPATTIIELLQLYHILGRVFTGDQLIQSVYWMYMRSTEFDAMHQYFWSKPLDIHAVGTDLRLSKLIVPYKFEPLPSDVNLFWKEPQIVSALNFNRHACKDRSVNAAFK
jgi:hypothetical protein